MIVHATFNPIIVVAVGVQGNNELYVQMYCLAGILGDGETVLVAEPQSKLPQCEALIRRHLEQLHSRG